jgi:protein tyrosine phosphatase (PTP) superfamily phosphohydrolase (DUF442 family)
MTSFNSSTALAAIYHFLKLSDQVATAGQPTAAQFSVIQEAGYQVVINLAPLQSSNALPNEQTIVEALGMEYIHIPVLWDDPTPENFRQFVDAMKAASNCSTFVHCAANMRVSAFMYLYYRLYQQMNDEAAQADLHQIWIPNETWQRFMNQMLNA